MEKQDGIGEDGAAWGTRAPPSNYALVGRQSDRSLHVVLS